MVGTAGTEKGKTMSDYIKREDALELINKCVSHTSPKSKVMDFHHGEINGLNWASDIIEAIPSANVTPVRHGHWVESFKVNAPPTLRSRWTCSWCGNVQTYGATDYCPNCGARMDGESDE